MRRSLVSSFVLLHFLIFSEVQGIRLGKGISVFELQTIHGEESSENGNIVANADGTVACKHGKCTGTPKMTRRLSSSSSSSKRIYRKLVTTKTTSTTVSYSISKNVKTSKENFVVHPSPVVESHPDDMLEIAEMDYSPAKRRPPIHN